MSEQRRARHITHSVFRPASSLLEHPIANNWLCSFQPQEQCNLELMLKHMTLVSPSYLNRWLEQTLLERANAQPNGTPIAVYTIRDLLKEERRPQKKSNPNTIIRERSFFDSTGHNAQTKFRSDEIGSEHYLAYLTRSIRSLNDSAILDHPSLTEMKSSRVKEIVLVDTVSYSGTTVYNFIDFFHDHPTLRSWMSSKFIRYKIAICIGQVGVDEIIRQKFRNSNQFQRPSDVEILTDVSSPVLDDKFLIPLKNLSYRLAKEDRKYFEHGFKGNMSSTIMGPRVSNNIPGILWSGNQSLFPNRTIPTEFEPFIVGPPRNISALSRNLNLNHEMLVVLSLWSRGFRKPSSMMLSCQYPQRMIVSLIEQARSLELILPSGQLSDRVKHDLKNFCKTTGCPHQSSVTFDTRTTIPYYKSS